MSNPITPTGTFFPAPVKTPMYMDEAALKKGELSRPWIMWFQLTSGAAQTLGGIPPFVPFTPVVKDSFGNTMTVQTSSCSYSESASVMLIAFLIVLVMYANKSELQLTIPDGKTAAGRQMRSLIHGDYGEGSPYNNMVGYFDVQSGNDYISLFPWVSFNASTGVFTSAPWQGNASTPYNLQIAGQLVISISGGSGGGGGGVGPQGPPGQRGPQGFQGPAGPVMLLDPEQPDEVFPLLGPQGQQGPAGGQGIQGPQGAVLLLEPDQPDYPFMIPGNQGQQGITGSQGPLGPPIFLSAEEPEDTPFVAPIVGPVGPTGAAGGAGPAGADGVSAYPGYTLITKSADQDVTNNSTLTNDTEFQFSVLANHRYDVIVHLIWSHNNATGSYKWAFHVNAGTMKGFGTWHSSSNIVANAAATTTSAVITTGVADIDVLGGNLIRFALLASADATLTFQFANNAAASGRTSRTCKGSMLWYKDIT